jgi:hypothetical protein
MKLISFQLLNITKVTTEKKKSKEEKANEITKVIIKGAKISDPIEVTFLSDPAFVPPITLPTTFGFLVMH